MTDLFPDPSETAAEMLARADRYAWSARWLSEMRPDGQASFPAVWQCGLQAIELYLSAYLSAGDFDVGDMDQTDRPQARGLVLRPPTRAHLERISRRRNYLAERFSAADTEAEEAELSQLRVTLDDLDGIVRAAVAPDTSRLTPLSKIINFRQYAGTIAKADRHPPNQKNPRCLAAAGQVDAWSSDPGTGGRTHSISERICCRRMSIGTVWPSRRKLQ